MDFLTPDLLIAFATLLLLEIVLGIDNVVFISILAAKLPAHQQARARRIGLLLALVTRILLLFSLSWIIGLTAPWFTVFGQEISGRDLILILGGLFLLGKATYEIGERLEGEQAHAVGAGTASFGAVLGQIVVLDMVFSLDSVITAVGTVDELSIMVAAVMIAIGIMLLSAEAISGFVDRHPTVKMLALSFLVLIGASLIADGFDFHIPKGYIYGPIAFSILVEVLNLRVRARNTQRRAQHAPADAPDTAHQEGGGTAPVQLRPAYVKSSSLPSRPAAGSTRIDSPRGQR